MSDIELYQCFTKLQKDYLISITIHKAKDLNVVNADTFVEIFFNNETKRTRIYRSSNSPFFNEYFVFELKTTLEELLRKNIRLTAVQVSNILKKTSIIGEVNVNLSSIWKQEYHTFIKKWGVLEKIGIDHKNITAGYLQIDLSIISTSENPAPASLATLNNEIVEKNLLLPDATACSNPVNVKYLVNIFDGSFILKRDYILQVSFGSFITRTRQLKYTKYCRWNEQMIFYGKFQSLNQMMILDLLVPDNYFKWRVKSTIELNFNDMCWNIDGTYTKPAFGPSHLTFYEGEQKNNYFGKILVSIETHDVDEKTTISSLHKKQDIIMPINESEYWNEEIFTINMIIVHAEAINSTFSSIKVNLCCEDMTSNTVDIFIKDYKNNRMKLKYMEYSSADRPHLAMSIKLPDNRLKNQAQNLMRMLYREMESHIRNFKLFEAKYYNNNEYQVKCLNMLHNDLGSMLEGMKNKVYSKTFKKLTEWDQNYLKFLQATFDKCITKINKVLSTSHDEKNVKSSLQEYLNIWDILFSAMTDVHGSHTEVYLNITKENKLLGFHRFSMTDYLYSQAFDSKGEFAGKLQSIIVKPSTCLHSCENCGCMFGKFEIIMWIGSDKEHSEWLPQNAIEISSHKINFAIEKYYRCNAYVHQTKIQPGIGKYGHHNTKLMIVANGMFENTKVMNQTMSIIWNEVLVIDNIKLFDIGGDVMYHNFPSIVVFLYTENKKKVSIIGIAHIKIPIKSCREKRDEEKSLMTIPESLVPEKLTIRKVFNGCINQFPPQLRWINFYLNGAISAEVLMSVEMIPLNVPIITIMEKDKNNPIPLEISPNIRKFHLEVTFAGIRDVSKISQFSSPRFRIEISIGDLALTSNFSMKVYKKNLNFIDPYASGYLLLPEEFQYWPPIIIKHLDFSHKIPTTIGAALIRRPEQFFVKEKPKEIQRFILPDINSNLEIKPNEATVQIDENEPLISSLEAEGKFPNLKQAFNYFKLSTNFTIPNKKSHARTILLENQYTWWTKFYNSNRHPSLRNESIYDLVIYQNELEKQTQFEYLCDWATPIDLYRASNNLNEKHHVKEKYAKLKCSIKIAKCYGKEFFETENLMLIPSTFRFKRLSNLLVEIPILVRVYIVQATNLTSRDALSHSDAFIKIEYGNQIISDRAHYIPNQFSPVFGKRYQINGKIPNDTILKISIYDRDTLSKDDLIGKTKIDIENRLRTKYGASCGLQKEYESKGYNSWRHPLLPSEILLNICNENDLKFPQYFIDHVSFAGVDFVDKSLVTRDTDMKERLALEVLNNFDKIPFVGHKMVPEHVETRSLYRKDRPGIEQGKLMMWIEIFDPKKAIPEPIDITPIPPRTFELRVIIWNTKDVILDEKNIFGKKMSDIYIKCWMENINDAQFTDIHYRSLTGEGNFNWRLIFPFKYSVGEDMMIITKKKNPFEKFDTEIKLPPVLNIQVWDNDTFSPDDFLGANTINLSHFPQFASKAEKCHAKHTLNYVNIFAVDGSLRGWCPVFGKTKNKEPTKMTGKVEIELEVLTKEKAKSSPAGRGREGPNKLPPPNRPSSSFVWYENPVLSMKHIVWPEVRKLTFALCMFFLLLLILLVLISFIFGLPQKLFRKLIPI